jgi:hypothetical protein
LRRALNPGDFIPKSETEINSFNDSIFSSAMYSVFIMKKMSSNNIDIVPFKEMAYSKTGRLSFDLNYIKSTLEKRSISSDPYLDARKKRELLENEISNCKNAIENFKKYKNIFKKLDKDINNECQEYLKSIDEKDRKTIEWVEKYRLDLIRLSYTNCIKYLASNVPSESSKYNYTEDELFNKQSLFEILYSKGVTQKGILQNIVGVLSSQEHNITTYIKQELVKNIIYKLFITNKSLFDQTYFEYPAKIELTGGNDKDLSPINLVPKEISYTIDQIKIFIQDWNGNPNLKSFLNVIFGNTKDLNLLDKYLKAMLSNNAFSGFSPNIYFNNSNFEEKIVDFIGKSKVNNEEELIQSAINSLSDEFFNLMKNSIATSIYDKLNSPTGIVQTTSADKVMPLTSFASALAPKLSSYAHYKWAKWNRSQFETGISTDRNTSQFLDAIIKSLYNDFSYYGLEINDLELKSKYDDIYKEIESLYNLNKTKSSNLQDRYDIIDNMLNIISPILSNYSDKINFKDRYDRADKPPIIVGGSIVYHYKETDRNKKPLKVIDRKSYNSITTEDDDDVETLSFSNIYHAATTVSPTIQDFYLAISSLKKKLNISNFEIKDSFGKESDDKVKLLLNEMNYPWVDVYKDSAEISRFKSIIDSYNMLDYNPSNIVSTIKTIVEETKTIESINEFNKRAGIVSKAFGGAGFKDISAGIEGLISRNNLQGISKKDFISKISAFINKSFTGEAINVEGAQDLHIPAFFSLLSPTNKVKNFDDLVAPIIKKLNLKDFNVIMQTCYQISYSDKNFSGDDINRVLTDGLLLDDIDPAPAVNKIINAAAFLHNHRSIPQTYFQTIINSPNFYSDSKISKEYIESCTILFKYGGMEQFSNKDSNVYKIIEKMIVSDLINDVNQFKNELIAFSQLCMKKDGIRSNLGNSTAEIKLNYLIKKIVSKNVEQANIDLSTHIPSWDSLTFEDKVVKLKEYVVLAHANGQIDLGWDTTLARLYTSIYSGEFDREVDSIRKNASTKEQYADDLRVKSIIQKASSNLKMLEMADSLITYSKGARKKDERLFNFEYSDPKNSFRFRVLRNLDPYHFLVGADTACCQRVGGHGHNAAVDSFINPLAGVLLLEVNLDDSWVTASQSYFHYVPNNNGLILDNVEYNHNNATAFFGQKRYDINQLYAAFADYLKTKYNLSYVRCGTSYNKLKNDKFTKTKLKDGDPRHFEYKKYSDFSSSSHIDLLRPKFDLSVKFE